MAEIEYKKIILRRGPAADLPGEPILGDPPTFTTGLDAGEMAFATDEGRLFIGVDPEEGQPTFERTEFPYQNIEILTENSTGAFSSMHSLRMREGGGDDYYKATLTDDSEEWVVLNIYRNGATHQYRIEDVSTVMAYIDYAVSRNDDGTPVRIGQMIVTYYADSELAPQLVNESYMTRDLSLITPNDYDPTMVFDLIDFRFVVGGTGTNRYLGMQYKNMSGEALNVAFKVSRPFPEFVAEPE